MAMSEFLKGNYKVTGKIETQEPSKVEAIEREFYRRAHQRLGGSIAFIMKSKSLLWKGDKKVPDESRGGDGTAGD